METPAPASRKSPLEIVLQSSVIATCVAGLLTTVVGGYLLDLFKANSLEVERAREKQAAIISSQLDVLESLNSLLADYKLAAEFVIYDIVEREGTTLEDQQSVLTRIAAYDEASRAFLAGAYREMFRVRMFFRDPELCDRLETHLTMPNQPGNLIAIDGALSVQIAAYKQAADFPHQAKAPSVFKTIGFEPVEQSRSEAVKSALVQTRGKLRKQFEEITELLEQLADSTVAKN